MSIYLPGSRLIPLVALMVLAQGCADAPMATEEGTIETLLKRGPEGFPAAQDLAVLMPMNTDYPIAADDPTWTGRPLLSPTWLDQVSRAFEPTEVGDALEVENHYSDWRVVSARIAPCTPVGAGRAASPDTFCWPQVRVVWQPVLRDFFVRTSYVDAYGEDRAIHTLYRVMPEGQSSSRELDKVLAHFGAGGSAANLDRDVRQAFIQDRDAAIVRLLSATAKLRSEALPRGALDKLGMRWEMTSSVDEEKAFAGRFADFLGRFAEPEALHELTAFSLPEGREPAHLNAWVFIAFNVYNGQLTQRTLEITDRETGKPFLDIGPAETVRTDLADPSFEAALENPSLRRAVEAAIIFSSDDADADDLGRRIADPDQTLVPNTSCGTCHRLNGLRFDFHSLSYFEDRDMTISPRVLGDLAREKKWVSRFSHGVN